MSDQDARPTLDQFADIIGEEAALQLSVRYGGRRLYIPKEAGATSELVRVIGAKAAILLSRRFGGVHFEMPLERGKRERIILLSNSGRTVRDIAELVGCTERHVKYVRADALANGDTPLDVRPRLDPAQVDLFGGAAQGNAPSGSPTSEDE